MAPPCTTCSAPNSPWATPGWSRSERVTLTRLNRTLHPTLTLSRQWGFRGRLAGSFSIGHGAFPISHCPQCTMQNAQCKMLNNGSATPLAKPLTVSASLLPRTGDGSPRVRCAMPQSVGTSRPGRTVPRPCECLNSMARIYRGQVYLHSTGIGPTSPPVSDRPPSAVTT
jgi:hypothetical protein